MPDTGTIIWTIFLVILAFLTVYFGKARSERENAKSIKIHDTKADVLPRIASEYGFTYERQGIYHYYTLKQLEFNWDPYSGHNERHKKSKNGYYVPYSTTYDYLHGIYRGVEMTGSSVRFNELEELKGYI